MFFHFYLRSFLSLIRQPLISVLSPFFNKVLTLYQSVRVKGLTCIDKPTSV